MYIANEIDLHELLCKFCQILLGPLKLIFVQAACNYSVRYELSFS